MLTLSFRLFTKLHHHPANKGNSLNAAIMKSGKLPFALFILHPYTRIDRLTAFGRLLLPAKTDGAGSDYNSSSVIYKTDLFLYHGISHPSEFCHSAYILQKSLQRMLKENFREWQNL